MNNFNVVVLKSLINDFPKSTFTRGSFWHEKRFESFYENGMKRNLHKVHNLFHSLLPLPWKCRKLLYSRKMGNLNILMKQAFSILSLYAELFGHNKVYVHGHGVSLIITAHSIISFPSSDIYSPLNRRN